MTTTSIPATVSISGELLLEAAGYVEAVGALAAQLNEGIETDVTDHATDLVVRLADYLYEPPDGDKEYREHPVNVSIDGRSRLLVDEVLKRYPVIEEGEASELLTVMREDVAALSALFTEIRTVVDELNAEEESLELIPGGQV